jgi:hypothetical protein
MFACLSGLLVDRLVGSLFHYFLDFWLAGLLFFVWLVPWFAGRLVG